MIATAATRDLSWAKNRAEKLAIGEAAQLLARLRYDVSCESPPHQKTRSEQWSCCRASNYARSYAIARTRRARRCVLIVCLFFF